MSRTNPYKRKRRVASRTLIMYGEGLGEEMFLKYLRGLYARNSGVAVTIRNGKGGNAVKIIIDAANAPGDFDRRVVVLDNGNNEQGMNRAREEAARRRIVLIENRPCLEAVLLSIVGNGQSFSSRNSTWCKKEFESKYIDKKKRSELSEYAKAFPKALLDQQRSKVSELDTLLSFIEGSRR